MMTISNNGYGGYEMSRGGDSRQIVRDSDGTYKLLLNLDSLVPIFESIDLEEVIDYVIDEL